VAQVCNPSYSGGRDQEGCGSKPALVNSARDSISKILSIKLEKKGLVEWFKVKALSSNPSTTHTKKILNKLENIQITHYSEHSKGKHKMEFKL
jgi:ribosomal protein S19E (S16A)